jgi:uncharacterized protein
MIMAGMMPQGFWLSPRLPRMKTLLLCLALLAPTAQAATLPQALTDYDEGRMAAAARGFQALAKRGEPLAQFNLAMMHLRRELPGASDRQAWALLNRAAAQSYARAERTPWAK